MKHLIGHFYRYSWDFFDYKVEQFIPLGLGNIGFSDKDNNYLEEIFQ